MQLGCFNVVGWPHLCTICFSIFIERFNMLFLLRLSSKKHWHTSFAIYKNSQEK